MTNAVTIGPMGICALILTAGALGACGGGGSGSPLTATTEASSSSPAATNLDVSDASGADTADPRPASAKYAEAVATANEIQAVVASLAAPGNTDVEPQIAAAASTDDNSPPATSLVAESSDSSESSVNALAAPKSTTYYVKVADEHHIFTVPNNTVVRFGAAGTNNWITKTVSGAGQCTNEWFKTDPSVGILKVCQFATTNAALAAAAGSPAWSKPTGQMPVIDLNKIPTPWVAYSTLRVTTNSMTTPKSDIGAFRTACGPARVSFDDPIVFPGQPGKSHLHTFFGNTGADANSTPESLRTTGQSTCFGGIANRSAYWVPTIIDVRTGTPVIPEGNSVYYKSGYLMAPSAIKTTIPVGLRMIAGNPAAKTPGAEGSRFICSGGPNNENDKYGSAMGNCDVGAQLVQNIQFPQCWDGVNLDSPDHKSHMANPVNGACPKSHPVAIPSISFNIGYTITEKDQTLHWRLSSDNYDPSLPGGYSSHGDWFNGWKSDISDKWGKNCVIGIRDCHSDLLGDGGMIY